MTEKHIAVIGAGYWGKNLVRNFHQLGVLKTICDGAQPVRDDMAKTYPDVSVTAAPADVLTDPAITGVVIAAPAALHHELAAQALNAGKHVFVEKPLSLTHTDGEALVRLAAQKQKTLFVGHILHYHAAVIRLKEMIRAGVIGRLQYIYSRRLSLGKIRREENILWSFAPHDISLILGLTGEEPSYLDSVGSNFLHARIADVTMTNLKFPSGIGAHIFVSWLNPYKEQKLVIVGSSGMLVFDDTQPVETKLVHYPHTINWQNGLPVPHKAESRPVDIAPIWKEPLKAECEAFLSAIQNGTPPLTSGEEGLRVLKILELSQHSLEQKENGVIPASSSVIPAKAGIQENVISTVGRNLTPLQHRTLNVEHTLPLTPDHVAASSVIPASPSVIPAKAGIQENVISTAGRNLTPFQHRTSFFAHETAIIDDNVQIGKGTKIWHFSHILSGSKIGQNCNIGQNVVIGPDAIIGNKCKIQNNVSVYKGVTLEDGVFCGPSMVFTNISNPRAEIGKMDQVRPTLVKRGATLGANCTIVCGHTIGSYAFIGAGAVVTKDVPDHALMAGNPACQIGYNCVCGEKLNNDLQCPACNKKYSKVAKGLLLTPDT